MASGDLTATSPTTSQMDCSVFNGADSYVEIPHNSAQLGANLSPGFTISAWINPRSIGETTGMIINKGSGSPATNGFAFFCNTTNRVSFQVNSAATSSTNNAVPFGTWTHVLMLVRNNTTGQLYINGTANNSGSPDYTTITTTNAARIGNRAGNTDRTFDGSIRSVKMWNRVLTTAEITADYNGQDPNRSHLIHEFKLEKDYADTGRIGVVATNSNTYFNKDKANAIIEDVRRLNLVAVTDKLKIIPITNMNKRFIVVGANRTA